MQGVECAMAENDVYMEGPVMGLSRDGLEIRTDLIRINMDR